MRATTPGQGHAAPPPARPPPKRPTGRGPLPRAPATAVGDWGALAVQELFELLLAEPMESLPQDHGMVLLIDALDEAAKSADRNRLLRLIASSFKRLPPSVRLVITSRPYPEVTERIRAAYGTTELDPDREENVADLAKFVEHVLRREGDLSDGVRDAAVQAVMANARGSYTYAIAVLDEPGWFDRFEDGAEAKDIALELPSSLEDAYEGLLADFERASPADHVTALRERLFPAMVAAVEPATVSELAGACDLPVAAVRAILGALSTIVKLEGPPGRQFAKVFHKSVSDWLVDRSGAGDYFADPAAGNALLFEWAARVARDPRTAPHQVPGYVAAHGVTHATRALEAAGDGVSEDTCGKIAGIASSVALLQAAYAAEMATEHASKVAALLRVAEGLRSEAAAGLARTLGLVTRSLGLLGPSVAGHPDLLVPAFAALPESSPLQASAAALGRDSPGVPALPAEPRDSRFGRLVYKLQGHHGQVLGCKAIDGGRRVVSWGSAGLVIFWDVLSGMSQARIRPHGGPVGGAEELRTPDGRVAVVTWGDDRLCRVTEVPSGEPLAQVPTGFPGAAQECLPVLGGSKVLMWAVDSPTPELWSWTLTAEDPKSAEDHVTPLKAHSQDRQVVGVQVFREGTRALTWSNMEGNIVIFDLETETNLVEFQNRDLVNHCSLALEERLVLAYGSQGARGCLSLWPVPGEGARVQAPLATLAGTHGKVDQCVLFQRPDGSGGSRWCVAGGANKHTLLWDVDAEVRAVLAGEVRGPDGAGEEGPAAGARRDQEWITECGGGEHDHLCVSEDGTRLVVSGWADPHVALLDAASGDVLYRVAGGYRLHWVYSVVPRTRPSTWSAAFLPGRSDTIVVNAPPPEGARPSGPQAWVQIVRVTGKDEARVLHSWMHHGHADRLRMTASHDEGTGVTRFVSSLDRTVRVVDVGEGGASVAETALDGHATAVRAVVSLPAPGGDGPGASPKLLSLASDSMGLWDASPAGPRDGAGPGAGGPPTVLGGRVDGACLVGLASGQALLCAWGGELGDPCIEFWDGAAGACVGRARGHTAAVRTCAPLRSAVGQVLVASGGWDGRLCLWAVPAPGSAPGAGAEPVATAELGGAVMGIAAAADGTRAVAWGGRSLAVMASPGAAPAVVEAPGPVDGAAVVPGGAGFVAWDREGSLALYAWDGSVARRLEGHRGRVLQAAVSDDGQTLATIGRDAATLAWDLGSGEPLWDADSMDVRSAHEPLGLLLAGEVAVTWDREGALSLRRLRGNSPGTAKQVQAHRGRVKTCVAVPGGRVLSVAFSGEIASWGPDGSRHFTVRAHSAEVMGLVPLLGQRAVLTWDHRDGRAAAWSLDSGRVLATHGVGHAELLDPRQAGRAFGGAGDAAGAEVPGGGSPLLACFTSGQRSVLRIVEAASLAVVPDLDRPRGAGGSAGEGAGPGDGADFEEKAPGIPTLACVSLPSRSVARVFPLQAGPAAAAGGGGFRVALPDAKPRPSAVSIPGLALVDGSGAIAFTEPRSLSVDRGGVWRGRHSQRGLGA